MFTTAAGAARKMASAGPGRTLAERNWSSRRHHLRHPGVGTVVRGASESTACKLSFTIVGVILNRKRISPGRPRRTEGLTDAESGWLRLRLVNLQRKVRPRSPDWRRLEHFVGQTQGKVG
jgi:hypothetical protein